MCEVLISLSTHTMIYTYLVCVMSRICFLDSQMLKGTYYIQMQTRLTVAYEKFITLAYEKFVIFSLRECAETHETIYIYIYIYIYIALIKKNSY